MKLSLNGQELNKKIGKELAAIINKNFYEVIVAPSFEAEALNILTAFVTEVNTVRTSMTNMTAMGTDGSNGGPLRGDALIRSYINRLKSITTTPIANYKDDPIYLSNLVILFLFFS